MKNILVTGGAGFIGGNFILKQIAETGNIILNFDKLTYAGNLETLDSVKEHSHYQFIKGDICNKELVRKTIEYLRPDAIVNFAAESHVDRSIDEPAEFIQTNIVGTSILLEEAYIYSKQIEEGKDFRFLHISTDEVYGTLGREGYFTESTPYNPSSPYSASKAASDHLVRAWFRTYGLPILITNCSNNYGPYQFPEKLIPLMILNCLDEKQLPVYGNGSNVRDWIYVEDHCDAIYTVLCNGKIGETYNIGGNNEKTNLEVVQMICEILDNILPRNSGKSYQDLITFVEDRPGHDFRYAIDSSKIKNELDWTPKETFKSGLKKTIKWYLHNKNWWQNIKAKKYQQQRLGVSK